MSKTTMLTYIYVAALAIAPTNLGASPQDGALPAATDADRAQQLLTPQVSGAVSLTPEAAEALRRKVLVQCGLPAEQHDNLPWYFHFEYGRALLETGDARRAIGHLTQSVELKPDPRGEERMYGMWFVEYLPYYRLADAHARLGNWPCAANAMQLSHAAGEDKIGTVDAAAYRRLDQAIEAQATQTGGCDKQDYYDADFVERRGDPG